MAGSEGDDELGDRGRLRRFEFGTEDEDLEAMQRDFLKNSSKPAARVVPHSQAPAVVGSKPKPSQMSTQEPKTAAGSNILSFAKSMVAAMDEFESNERSERKGKGENPAVEPRAPSLAQPKKLSLFAQRRLAKQAKSNASADSVGYTASAAGGECSAATFLPKLMAPIAENTISSPVKAPKLQLRESGFPDIPVDFSTQSQGNQSRQAKDPSTDRQQSDSWSLMRQQVSLENNDRINSMSETDILEAQAEIRSMASSKTMERLMRRVRGSEHLPDSATSTAANDLATTKQVRFADSGSQDYDDSSELPPPPPPAEWVNRGNVASNTVDIDNNDDGADSQFYKDLKRKYFPTEVLEEAKLAWILGHSQAKSPMEKAVLDSRRKDALAASAMTSGDGNGSGHLSDEDLMNKPISHVRFSFDGQIMTEQELDTPTYAGLHHHGDDPDRPGYTIPELLHLSRSTVPAQRAVAIATLGCIVHKVNIGAWDLAQATEVYAGLLDWQAELYFAHGFADANKTGRAEAVVALWTLVVETTKYKTLVRLTTGGQTEKDTVARPGADINMLATPAVAQGALVDCTFKALGSMLSESFLDSVYEMVDLSLVPDQQLKMAAETIKCLMKLSEEYSQLIHKHGRLVVLLQNRFPYLMQD